MNVSEGTHLIRLVSEITQEGGVITGWCDAQMVIEDGKIVSVSDSLIVKEFEEAKSRHKTSNA